MAVFQGSRYAETFIFQDDVKEEVTFIDPIRLPKYSEQKEDYYIQVKEGDRLDIIAKEMYGSEKLEWVLMDANPQYSSPLDVNPGDYIVVPHPDRVNTNV